MTTTTAPEELAAERGALLLDIHNPTWFQAVEPKTLALSTTNNCVLGQLYGSYGDGVRALGINRNKMYVELGFELPCGVQRYTQLNAAWRKEIHARRVEAMAA